MYWKIDTSAFGFLESENCYLISEYKQQVLSKDVYIVYDIAHAWLLSWDESGSFSFLVLAYCDKSNFQE